MTLVRSSLLGVGLGATSMFLLDPLRGARRRALIRDKMMSARRKTAEAAGATWRDLGNRMTGMLGRGRGVGQVGRGGQRVSQTKRLFSDEAVDDARVAERVKSALGRATAHQRAISVRTADQCVTLSGDALASEIVSIVSAVQRVRGVVSVQNNIRTHRTGDSIPMLQSGSRRLRQWTSRLADAWSPTALLAAGAALAVGAAALVRGKGDTLSAAGMTE
jgi:BON domain